jgi:hypothetical protein
LLAQDESGRFKGRASRGEFLLLPLLGCADALLRGGSSRANSGFALFHRVAARRLLLGEQLRAGALERGAVGAKLFLRLVAAGVRSAARAFNARAAFGQNAFDGIEKAPAQEKIEQKNQHHGGHGRKKQLAQLMDEVHVRSRGEQAPRLWISAGKTEGERHSVGYFKPL